MACALARANRRSINLSFFAGCLFESPSKTIFRVASETLFRIAAPSIPMNGERVGMKTLLENSVNRIHGTRLDSVRGQRSRERNGDRGKMREDERGRERRKRESSVQCCRISTAAFSVTFGTRGKRVRSHRRTRWPDLTYYSASGAVGIIRCIAI